MANFLEGLKQKYREILEPVTRTLSNVGSNAAQSWQNKPIVGGLAGQAIQRVQPAVQNYLRQVEANKQQPFFNSNNTPTQWLGKVGQDIQKRGIVEGLHDLSYPVLMNPYIQPIVEPAVSAVRVANYRAGRPSPLVNSLLGQTDAQMGITPKSTSQTTPFVGGLLGQAVNTVKTYTPPVNSRPYNILQKLAPVQQEINQFTDFVQGKGPRAERFRQSPIAKMTPEEMVMNFSPMGVTNVTKTVPQAIKQIVKSKAPQDVIDTISETLLYGKNAEARQLYKEAGKDFILPKFEQLSSQVKKIISGAETEASTAVKNQFGDYSDVIAKMKQFLAKNAETSSGNMLYREHIPTKIFGVSSDEVATALGMSERDFLNSIMPKITQVTKETPKIPLVGGKLKTIKDVLRLDENYQVGQSIEGAGMVPSYKNAKVYPLKGSISVEPKIRVKPVKTQAQLAQDEFANWQKGVFEREGVQTIGQAVKQAVGAVKQAASPLSKDVEQLKDIPGIGQIGRDFYRNFEKVYGKRIADVDRIILKPFDQAKGRVVAESKQWADKLENEIEKGLGIRRGSKESAAVQQFGEGQKNLISLVKEFGEQKAQKIIQADQWFRQAYNQLLDEVNNIRQAIYPNQPDKIIPKRQDYYRHFREMQEGLAGLKNIFETPAGVQSSLSGISHSTKPKSRFLSFAQKRLGMNTEIDAVGGFLDYIKKATYTKNIDPYIERFRALAGELEQATLEGPQQGKLNNFIEFLHGMADDMAGKTNRTFFDDPARKILGRKTMAALGWFNSRVKANTVIMNVASSLAQIFNVPQGMANVKNPVYWTKGLGDSLASMFTKRTPMDKSTFIAERYNRAFDRFDRGMIQNTKKFGVWMTQVLDEVGTKYIWNMHYEKALAEKIADPVRYADVWTRKMVAGRGIGELPLIQKSKTFQLVAPFQIEVGNLWWVMKDMVDERAFGKIATLFVLNHLFNNAVELTGRGPVTFDPIQATFDAVDAYSKEDDKKIGALKVGGRISGEVLSNIPLAQNIASLYPEYGATIGDTQLPTRRDLFGKQNPMRFGSEPLVVKGLMEPQYKVLPPFAGGQIKKTIEGTQAFAKGYNETSKGQVRYPIKQTLGNAVRSALFGQYATPEAKTYFDQNQKPLGEQQSELFKIASDQQKIYGDFTQNREHNNQIDKLKTQLEQGKQPQKTGAQQASFYINGSDTPGYIFGDKFLYPDPDSVTGAWKTSSIATLKKQAATEQIAITNAQYSLDVQRLKATGNINGWLQATKAHIQSLQDFQKSLDEKADKAKIISLQNTIEDLQTSVSKYKSYGGFSKPKKAKAIKIKAIKLKIPKSKIIKIKTVKPKKIKIYKVKSTKKLATNVKKIKITPPQARFAY